jgi:hypothetical protein
MQELRLVQDLAEVRAEDCGYNFSWRVTREGVNGTRYERMLVTDRRQTDRQISKRGTKTTLVCIE